MAAPRETLRALPIGFWKPSAGVFLFNLLDPLQLIG
jgi:hypothetical protein